MPPLKKTKKAPCKKCGRLATVRPCRKTPECRYCGKDRRVPTAAQQATHTALPTEAELTAERESRMLARTASLRTLRPDIHHDY